MSNQKNFEVNGTLLDHPHSELLAEISQSRLSGALRLSRSEQKIVIYFDGGEVVFAASNSKNHRLFHMLIRDEKILPPQLKEIPNFANDLELKANLLKKEVFTKKQLDEFFAAQVAQILKDTLNWNEGVWNFSPLIRIKAEMHISFDLADILFSYARTLPNEKIARRFKSLEERFGKRKERPAQISLTPQEAFTFARLDGESHSIEEIKTLSGLSEMETLKSLYILWLGGFLFRQRWNSAFSKEALAAILSTHFELKSKAYDVESAKEKAAEKPVEQKKPEEKPQETKEEVSLEEYLERVEKKATYYEILDVAIEAQTAEIKTAYFQLAKRFHPDLFYRRVEDELHRRVQNAFTVLAHAYETLRSADLREVYDFKLRKEIADLERRGKSAKPDKPQTPLEILEEQAADSFDQGFNLLMDEEYEDAIPFLARAVHHIGGNARYRAYLGKALSASKETYRQAESELQHALRIEPENLDYRLMLADLYIKIGLNKRAEGELKRILEKSPNNHEAHSLLDSLHNK